MKYFHGFRAELVARISEFWHGRSLKLEPVGIWQGDKLEGCLQVVWGDRSHSQF